MWINEALQWALLVALALLLLGVLRQLAAVSPARRRRSESGPEIGDRLASRVRTAITGESADVHVSLEKLVVFVSEGCVGCMRLLSDLKEAGMSRSVNGVPLVVVARVPTTQFEYSLRESGFDLIPDRTGELWAASHVTTTPLVVRIDAEHRVLTKAVTIDVASVAAS